jgi:endonuclease/exonuclease/phosphatase family metal-dependent hydrolase
VIAPGGNRRGRALRVATFNLRRGLDAHGRLRLGGLTDACQALDADVIGLQEVDRRRWRSRLVDQLAYVARRLRYAHAVAPAQSRHLGRGYGNALLVRGAITDTEARTLPGTGTQQPRVALLARVEVAGTALSVAVSHLQHHPRALLHLPDEAPEQLRAVLGWLRERPGPRLLLADLNLQPPRAVPMLEGAGFTVAIAEPAYPAVAPRLQLDYIAVEGLSVESAGVAPAAVISDHCPVVATVRVATRA